MADIDEHTIDGLLWTRTGDRTLGLEYIKRYTGLLHLVVLRSDFDSFRK